MYFVYHKCKNITYCNGTFFWIFTAQIRYPKRIILIIVLENLIFCDHRPRYGTRQHRKIFCIFLYSPVQSSSARVVFYDSITICISLQTCEWAVMVDRRLLRQIRRLAYPLSLGSPFGLLLALFNYHSAPFSCFFHYCFSYLFVSIAFYSKFDPKPYFFTHLNLFRASTLLRALLRRISPTLSPSSLARCGTLP